MFNVADARAFAPLENERGIGLLKRTLFSAFRAFDDIESCNACGVEADGAGMLHCQVCEGFASGIKNERHRAFWKRIS
ncbi:MAG: hypothetical protein KHY61_02770 [Sutterella wadsworthensis]|nr:hypothetical protein [Sutterella seckii]MBS5217014.1 hypothetical protein [Sutterella wadsworthensis]